VINRLQIIQSNVWKLKNDLDSFIIITIIIIMTSERLAVVPVP